jgi:hypothetical protein
MGITTECLKQEVYIPIKIVKRGSAKSKIIAPNDGIEKTSLNRPLARALVKAYKWEKEIAKIGDVDMYCRRYRLSKRYVQRIMRLNNLSPSIKKAILDGKFPQNILLQDMIYKPIPLIWREQDQLEARNDNLGIDK